MCWNRAAARRVQQRHRSSVESLWSPGHTRPWGLLVGRRYVSLPHLLTSTPLRTWETACNTTAGDVTSACQEPAAWSGFFSEVSAPHSCTFRGSMAPWGVVKQRELYRGGWVYVLVDCWSTTGCDYFQDNMLICFPVNVIFYFILVLHFFFSPSVYGFMVCPHQEK